MPIRLNHISFTFADATTPILSDITTTFSARTTGIVGRNGSGKTTLLHLLTGQLAPTSGTITGDHKVGYLPQDIVRHDDRRILDLLGIKPIIDALARIEAGSIDPIDFDAVGDDWDIRERAQSLLAQHLPSLGTIADLDRTADTLSGGEIMQIALLGLQLRGYKDVVLDEPTNNLDTRAREHLYALIDAWRGCLVIVSHDIDLLNLMDTIAEVRDGSVRIFDGNYDTYTRAIDQEQAAIEQDIRDAEREAKIAKHNRISAQVRLAHAERTGQTQKDQRKHTQKMAAMLGQHQQELHGRQRQYLGVQEKKTVERLDMVERLLRDDDAVCIDLPDPQVSSSRNLAEFHHTGGTIMMRGPERIAIVGDNGVGKTTLLRTLIGEQHRMIAYATARTDRIGYLSQKIDDLPDQESTLTLIEHAAPQLAPGEIRNRLARFLIRGEDVYRPIGTLSGGERFRVALARLLLTEPAHQLLLLDEPTNNLDIDTATQLVEALRTYRGGIIIASHDQHLLNQLNLTITLALDQHGYLLPPPYLSQCNKVIS
ncbi:MAG: ABC-F family ATP-binding cassette domain-containing protein [Propionibacteriaceae bacterium]